MRNTVFTAFLHHIDSSYSFCAVLLDNFAPYSLLIHCLCGATCHFSTVQPPHTLSIRCCLIILHRTASSYSAYAVPLAIFTPYRLLIHCLCGVTCQFHTVQSPHTLPMRCHLPISHRTGSSYSAYAVPLAFLAPYRFLTLYLYGAACCFCPTAKQYLLPEQRNTRNSLQSYAYKLHLTQFI